MKRYLLFASVEHKSAYGGWDSFLSSFDSKVDAIVYFQFFRDMSLQHDVHYSWMHIVDSTTGKIIFELRKDLGDLL